jgi:carboxypeptidase family protein
MRKQAYLVLVLVVVAACSPESPTAPPLTTFTSLHGRVTESGTTAGIDHAEIFIDDGPNAHKLTFGDADGNFFFTGLWPSDKVTVRAWAPYHFDQVKLLSLAAANSNTVSFELVGGAPAGYWDY